MVPFLAGSPARYPMRAHSEAYGNCGNVSRYSSRGNENWQRSGHVRLSDTSLANRPSGVLFVGRRRVQRLELDVITGGIDLLDGSRPISRPVTSVIAIIDPLASAAGVDDLVAPLLRATFAFATVRNALLRVMRPTWTSNVSSKRVLPVLERCL